MEQPSLANFRAMLKYSKNKEIDSLESIDEDEWSQQTILRYPLNITNKHEYKDKEDLHAAIASNDEELKTWKSLWRIPIISTIPSEKHIRSTYDIIIFIHQ